MKTQNLILLFLVISMPLNGISQNEKILTKRNFKNIKTIKTIDIPDFTLYNLKIYNNLLYGVNYSNQEIVIFDLEKNKTVNTIGGRGEGPEEFKNIATYKIIDDYILVLDNQGLSLKKFSLKGGFLNSTRINYPFMKGYIIDWSHLLLTTEEMPKEKGEYVAKWSWFEYDLNTSSKSIYNTNDIPFFKERNAAIKYDGNFYQSISGNTIIYSPSYKNGYIKIKNNLITINNTIDNIEPNLYSSGLTRMMRNKLSSKYASSIGSNDKLVYFLTKVGTEKDDNYRALDVYDLENNKYLYSYKLNFVNESSPYDLVVNNNNIIVSYEENIVIYEF